jgi:hypothetical protein
MAQSYSDNEHNPSNYSGSYPSLSDSASSRHFESDMHPYESPEFGVHPKQPPLVGPHAPHGLASTLSNLSPQNFQSLQEYTARLEQDYGELEKRHLLLETQHETLR